MIDKRWQLYDNAFIDNKSSELPIPTMQICAILTDFCDIRDPEKFVWLCTDFINQLEEIKQEAIEVGLLK